MSGCSYTGSGGGAMATDTNTAADEATDAPSRARASTRERRNLDPDRAVIAFMCVVSQRRITALTRVRSGQLTERPYVAAQHSSPNTNCALRPHSRNIRARRRESAESHEFESRIACPRY